MCLCLALGHRSLHTRESCVCVCVCAHNCVHLKPVAKTSRLLCSFPMQGTEGQDQEGKLQEGAAFGHGPPGRHPLRPLPAALPAPLGPQEAVPGLRPLHLPRLRPRPPGGAGLALRPLPPGQVSGPGGQAGLLAGVAACPFWGVWGDRGCMYLWGVRVCVWGCVCMYLCVWRVCVGVCGSV